MVGREGGEGLGRGCCEGIWRSSNEEKRKEEIVVVRQILEVCVCLIGHARYELAFACLKLKAP